MPRAADRCHAIRSPCSRAARLPPCWPRWGPPGAEIPHIFRILPPRPEAHQAAPDGMAADKLQTLAKRMKKSSDARGASPWCRPNISNPARSQAKPRATLSCRSRHLHPLTGERQRGMPRGSLRERPNVLARDAREHVFASFSYDNGPADSAGVVRHWPALDTTQAGHTITRGAVAETASRAALSAQTCARSGTGLSCRNVGSASPASPRLASPQPLRRSSSCCCCSTVTAAAAVAALATVARAASARGARHSARRQRKYHRRSLRA